MARGGPRLTGGGPGGPEGPGGGGKQPARGAQTGYRVGRAIYKGVKTTVEAIQTQGLSLLKSPTLWATVISLFVFFVVMTALMVAGMGAATAARKQQEEQQQAAPGCGVVDTEDLVSLYEAASAQFGIDPGGGPAVLAAVNEAETDFGSNLKVSSAGAEGWMQFVPDTWEAYGYDADGNGEKDPYNPADAIYGAANYLSASGAPEDWNGALLIYNKSQAYVDEVLLHAERYAREGRVVTDPPSERLIGEFSDDVAARLLAWVEGEDADVDPGASSDDEAPAAGEPACLPGDLMRVEASDPWLEDVPGTSAQCDSRIVENVVYLIERFNLGLGDCYAPTGHSTSGEHPLGLAIDVWPADGNWDNTMAAARFVGWDESCAADGCPNALARWIGYNGVDNHGDPAHCGDGCSQHLHISWNHAEAAYNTQADWVDVWQLPSSDSG